MMGIMTLRVSESVNSGRYGICHSFFWDFWFFTFFFPDCSEFGRVGKRRNDRF